MKLNMAGGKPRAMLTTLSSIMLTLPGLCLLPNEFFSSPLLSSVFPTTSPFLALTSLKKKMEVRLPLSQTSTTTSTHAPLCCLPVTVGELPLCPPKDILHLGARSRHLQGVAPPSLSSPQHHQLLRSYSRHPTMCSYFSHLQNKN